MRTPITGILEVGGESAHGGRRAGSLQLLVTVSLGNPSPPLPLKGLPAGRRS